MAGLSERLGEYGSGNGIAVEAGDLASEYVVFLDQPVVGCPVAFVKNGQRATSSPVVSVGRDSSNSAMLIVQTASGSVYTGQYQPNFQPTMYGTQFGIPPQPGPMPRQQPGPGVMLDPNSERLWAMLSHIGMFVIGFIAPLVIMLTVGKDSRLVDHNAREALNFFITVLIAGFACGLLILVMIGIPLLIALQVYVIVAQIIAGVAAYNGQYYNYPVVIRFL